MNYSENKYRQKITVGQGSNHLMILIAICLILFVGLAFLKAVWYFRYPKEEALSHFNADLVSWFVLRAYFKSVLAKPWTLLTHMFVHDNFWKVFTNMLWLWSFGYIMQEMTGNKKIVPVFIYGALGGAVAFILACNYLPSLQAQRPFAYTTGASAGVMAVAIVTAMISRGYKIFPLIGGGIPVWVLTALYIISDLASVSFSDTAYLVSHLAGGLTGFLFLVFLRMGYDGSEWMNHFFDWVNNLFNPDRPRKGKNRKEELFYHSTGTPYKKTPHVTPERIDAILDKISKEGYQCLTGEEKELLKRAGGEDR